MKLLIAVAVCTALLAAVNGKLFTYKCIRLDINGTVTFTANETKVIDLDTVTASTNGDCTKNSSVEMTVTLDTNVTWVLTFKNANNKVTLDQTVSFIPAVLLNMTALNSSLTLSSKDPLTLSTSNASYECHSELVIPFNAKKEAGVSFDVFQNISFIQVQAFGLPKNESYSPAEYCPAGTTVTPTTVATTTLAPTPGPQPKVDVHTFEVKDSKQQVCFKLVAGLQFVVMYENTDNKTVLSTAQVVSGSANVTGTCASDKVNKTTMTITEEDYSLEIMETRAESMVSSTVKLTVKLDPVHFPKAKKANETVSFEMKLFEPYPAETFYLCDSQQQLTFGNTTTTLFTNDVQLQAFGLKNGSFSGEGLRCGLDPTPKPAVPGDNTYTVLNSYHNITCIVLTGEITFSNITYTNTNKTTVKSKPIVIPAMNDTTHNVKFHGNCDLEKGLAQQLVISFNGNWTLALTFAKGSSSVMLGASAKEYSLRDIELTYYLTENFFPNTSNRGAKVTAARTNITTDFLKGSTGGGSYKCDAKQTETLGEGVEFQTTNLQYKAFNTDNSTTFSGNVSECSEDDESNSIVPIAVGAALAGLVAIVLIAYLIGRRRSRRQGYESV